MKKIFALLLVAGAFTLTACGNKESTTIETAAPAADSTTMAPAPADTTVKADSSAAAAPAEHAPAAH